MTHRRSALGGLLLLALGGAALGAADREDVAGSRDPDGIERFPQAWIIAYQRDDAVAPRSLITGRVDRIRRELRVDDQIEVDGTLESVIYQMPEGTPVADVEAHYRERLDGQVLFRCSGRACGRSNDWANQVFGEWILYGPDRNQRYLAMEWQGRLVSLYVIERGNRRVYAQLQVLEPQDGAAAEPAPLLARTLAERGWAVIDGIEPEPDGSLSAGAREVLAQVPGRLGPLAVERLYVVCHVGDSGGDVAAKLAASQRCAESAREALREAAAAEGGAGPRFEGFGAGPLLPRSRHPGSRLELVLGSPDA